MRHTGERMTDKDPEEMTQEEARKEIDRLLRYAGKIRNQIERDRRLDTRSFYRSLEWMRVDGRLRGMQKVPGLSQVETASPLPPILKRPDTYLRIVCPMTGKVLPCRAWAVCLRIPIVNVKSGRCSVRPGGISRVSSTGSRSRFVRERSRA